MKDNNNKNVNTDNADETSTDSKQNAKTVNTGNEKQNDAMPDWVMHLLTGAGALGGSYLLFIKPLQKKFDRMTNAILLLEKKIEAQNEHIAQLIPKRKKASDDEDTGEEEESDDLFTVKRKHQKNGSSIHERKRTIRF